MSPKPGAYTYYNNKRMHLFGSDISDSKMIQKKIGALVETGNTKALFIQCNPGIIELRELKLEGKRRMSVEDFLRGHTLSPDTLFGSAN